MAEMIAMLNGLGEIPANLTQYLARDARSAVTSSAYNSNLAGLGAVGPNRNPGLPQRGGWQRRGLQRGLSLTAAATLQGRPTLSNSVAEVVRQNALASQIYSNRLAGIPESPAEAVKAAQAGIIASQMYSPNLAGLGAEDAAAAAAAAAAEKAKKDALMKNVYFGAAGLAVGYIIAKMMR